jgi:hypothetical protein
MLLEAQMPDLALTPTEAQYSDAHLVDVQLSRTDLSSASMSEQQQQQHQHWATSDLSPAFQRDLTSKSNLSSSSTRLFPLLNGLPAPGTSAAPAVAAAGARNLPEKPFEKPDVVMVRE